MRQATQVRILALAIAGLLIAGPLLFAVPAGAGFSRMTFPPGSGIGFALLAAAAMLGLAVMRSAPKALSAMALMVLSLFLAVGIASRFGPGFPDHIFFVVYVFAPLIFLLCAAGLGGRIDALGWFGLGTIGPGLKAALALLVLACLAVLMAYAFILKPDLTHQPLIRAIPVPALALLMGPGIAALNSLVEEAIYRGILYDGLKRCGINDWGTVAIQALAFGTFHLNSNEPGLVGVIMTTVLGLVLGLLRKFGGGLLAPYLLHFVLDIGVYSIGVAQVFGWLN